MLKRLLIKFLLKLGNREELLEVVVSIFYPGKQGFLVLGTPEELRTTMEDYQKEYSDQEFDFATDPKVEPKDIIQ